MQSQESLSSNKDNRVMENQNLSVMLRESTMKVHQEAESSQFIKTLFKGECSVEGYTAYLWALLEVYKTMEASLEKCKDHSAVEPVYWPTLFRTKELQADLGAWLKLENNPLNVPEGLRQAVDKYTGRLEELTAQKPELLVAHAYVRYLGDLSGGQMLAKALGRHYPQVEYSFLFYDYSHLEIPKAKTEYRLALDSIGEQEGVNKVEMCEEANHAFLLNSNLFIAIDELEKGRLQ
jgi:heme oxygenase